MPANKEAYIRYRIIDSCLRNKQRPFPTLGELAEKCEEVLGKTFSESTIQKDIYAMRFDQGLGFEAPIEYSKLHKGYSYTDESYSISSIPLKEEELVAIEFAAGILQQFTGVGLMGKFDEAITKIMESVNISRAMGEDNSSRIVQVEHHHTEIDPSLLETITQCIINKKVIRFNYHSFGSGKRSVKTLHPYLLKEYRNRWYVIGWSSGDKDMRTFGLERITEAELIKEKYYRHTDFDPDAYFKYSFGITVGDNKPEEIILEFKGYEKLYVKSQPLHSTQKTIKESDQSLVIALQVIPSPELTMAIRSYGAEVKVIKPAWLAKEIKSGLQSALKNYE
ncbi:MAG TPA: hypothetical protein DEP18_00370 [Flavobacteriales bacterium]|nr:hypothetical protein [Flavobacteriales bacterium]HCA82211.1 hypothetical protein [Flavobacteriales bacterium]HRE75015.1 WYL domain-containing protein [Flavobacteriales bacterium]HRE95357.1 WYL domain-containing protein [Flavobacteriales bacterium]HRJ35847.1 WYL domain-containing protein [Flavobacteriales bacterium]